MTSCQIEFEDAQGWLIASHCRSLPLNASHCQIEFEDAQGWLIGTENRGLNHMFTFINTSRVGTAVQVESDCG